MDYILVDNLGYNQFFEELEKLKQLSINNSVASSEAYESAIGDGWHDNFAFEDNMRESRKIANKIDKMLADKPLLKIVPTENYGEDVINLGDTLEIEIKYSENDIENEVIKLTGKYLPNSNSKIPEISLNSPLGRTIYGKKVNSKCEYEVNGNMISATIIRKIIV